jgi:hypothetical protein
MLDAQTSRERISRMLGLGRDIMAGGVAAANAQRLLDTLRAEGAHGRKLALFTCFTAPDGRAVLEALRDTDRAVRALAFALVPTGCTDEEAVLALRLVRLSFGDGKLVPLVRAFRRRRRFAVVDAYVEELEKDSTVPSRVFARVALNASVACLERTFERVIAALPTTQTRRILVERIGGASVLGCELLLRTGDHAFRSDVMQLMRDLGASRASAHLDLLDRIDATPSERATLAFAFHGEAGVDRLTALFIDHPSEALWNASVVWKQLDARVRNTVVGRFIDGALVPDDVQTLTMLLDDLTREQRTVHEERLWEATIARRRTFTMWPPYPITVSELQSAPESVRLREARRRLDEVDNDPKLAHYLLDYASLLPPVEAFDRLCAYVTHDDPMQRTPALLAWLRVLFNPASGEGALPPLDRLGAAVDFLLTHESTLEGSVLRYLLSPFDWFMPTVRGRAADVPRLERLLTLARERQGARGHDHVVRAVSKHLDRLREDA